MLGPKGMAFDNDDILDDDDDEDLKNDPVSQIDMQARRISFSQHETSSNQSSIYLRRTSCHSCENARPIIRTTSQGSSVNFRLKK